MTEYTEADDIRWMKNFTAYRGFVTEYCRNPTSSDIWEGIRVGKWLRNQRSASKKRLLTNERLELLNKHTGLWEAKEGTEKEEAELQMIEELAKKIGAAGKTPLTNITEVTQEIMMELIKNRIYCCEDILHTPNIKLKEIFKSKGYYLKAIAMHAVQPNITLITYRFIQVWLEKFGMGIELDKLDEIFNTIEINNNVKDILAKLNVPGREILTFYYGLEDGNKRTLDECSQKFKLSRVRVNQIITGSFRFMNQSGTINIAMHNSIVEEQRLKWCEQQKDAGKVKENKFTHITNNRIETLNLSTGIYNALKRAGINSIHDLIALDEWQLKQMRNIGKAGCLNLLELQKKILAEKNTLKL